MPTRLPPLAAPSTPAGRAARPFVLAAVIAFGSLAAALFTQHVLDMQPCSWCVAQRMAIASAGLLSLAGAALARRRSGVVVFAGLTAVAALGGLASAVWQQGWASKSLSCAFTLADRIVMKTGLGESLPAVFQPTASCAEANQALLGLPYAAWSALAFGLILIAMAAALAARPRGAGRT